MRKLAPLFRAESITAYFQHGRFDEDRSIELEEFLNDFAKLLIEFFPERVNYYVMKGLEYYKSEWNVIRGTPKPSLTCFQGRRPAGPATAWATCPRRSGAART